MVEKPHLTLVEPPITMANLVALYRALTGKDPKDADLAEAQAILDETFGEPTSPSP